MSSVNYDKLSTYSEMGDHGKYSPQPAYNEFLVPPAPPSYSEAVHMPILSNNLSPALHSDSTPVVPEPSVVSASQSVHHPAVLPAPLTGQMPQPLSAVPVFIQKGPVCVGPNPAGVTCPNCNNFIRTETRSMYQKSAHICCFLLCLFGCCLCSCIPYCCKSFKNINHYCPQCQSFVGVYKH